MIPLSETTGRTLVVVYGRLFEGVVGDRIDDDLFEVSIGDLNTVVPVKRDMDYIFKAPVPLAPLTLKGLRWAETHALNAFDAMEAGTVHRTRYPYQTFLEV